MTITSVNTHVKNQTEKLITDNHSVSSRESQVVGTSIIRQIQIVRMCRPFGRYRVDLFDKRCYS